MTKKYKNHKIQYKDEDYAQYFPKSKKKFEKLKERAEEKGLFHMKRLNDIEEIHKNHRYRKKCEKCEKMRATKFMKGDICLRCATPSSPLTFTH